MKVLILVDVFHPCPEPGSQRLHSFAKALLKQNHEVMIITGNSCTQKRGKASANDGFPVYDLNYSKFLLSVSSVLLNPVLILLFFFASMILVLKEGVDVILASVPNGEGALAAFAVSKISRASAVIDMRDLYPSPSDEFRFLYLHMPTPINEALIKIFNIIYANSSLVTCAYEGIRNKLVERGIPSRKTVILPNGADTTIYKPYASEIREKIRLEYGLPLKKTIFVYAGALIWYYPMDEAIKGLKKCSSKRDDLELLIISHRDYAPYRRLAEKEGLRDLVRFMGPLCVEETAKILAACDVGIVSYPGADYFKNLYSSKIFSYMSCGIPVLASGPPNSVIDELISKHKVGYFIGRPSEKNFEKGFLFFLDNGERNKLMGENARTTIEKFYDRRKIGLKLVSVIKNYSGDVRV